MKRGMPSGAQTPDGIISLLALIFSKAPPRYPPHHGAHWAYTAAKRISEDTKPELVVRSFLFRHGFRFQLHVKVLPGHPDIVLSKYKTVIEVRGCFWHRHPGCRQTTTPSTNVEFWQEKFKRNVDRDRKTEKQLKELGWNLIVVWQCELQKDGFLETLPDKIKKHLP